MYNFSILVDDIIAPDFEGKIQFCNQVQIGNMEISDLQEGKGLAAFDGAALETLRRLLIKNHKKLVLLNTGSPLSDLDYFKELFKRAYFLGVENVNILLSGEEREKEFFSDNLKTICRMGQTYGLRVLLENNAASFLSRDKALGTFYKKIKTENTGIIFNPFEYTKLKCHPFFHEFYNSKLKGEIKFLRVNDGLFVNGEPVLPTQGNSEIKELVSILLARSFKGYFSFTPYLVNRDKDTYIEVIESFKALLLTM